MTAAHATRGAACPYGVVVVVGDAVSTRKLRCRIRHRDERHRQARYPQHCWMRCRIRHRDERHRQARYPQHCWIHRAAILDGHRGPERVNPGIVRRETEDCSLVTGSR